jgi:hypothetical protein
MPTSRRALVIALVALVAVTAANAERSIRKAQEVSAPYWTSEPGGDTELQLKKFPTYFLYMSREASSPLIRKVPWQRSLRRTRHTN